MLAENHISAEKKIFKVYLNEILTNKEGVQFKVTDVQNQKSFEDINGYGIETDYNFVCVTIEIYNGNKKEYYVNPNHFYLLKSDGTKFTYDLRTYRFEEGMTSDYLQPGLKNCYVLLFETPTKTSHENYHLICDTDAFGLFEKAYYKAIYLRCRTEEKKINRI